MNISEHSGLNSTEKRPQADICVVGGAGHVGLPLSIVFASKNQRVLIYDLNLEVMNIIRNGQMPFMEIGAEALLRSALAKGLLEFTNRAKDIANAKAVIITIGTPVDEFLTPSLRVMTQCLDDLLPFLSEDQLVVIRSTVYPGVTESMAKYALSKGKRLRLAPEVVRLAPTEAELAKVFTNAYRYIHFAVTNQFYMIASAANLDYYRILDGMKRNYPRSKDFPLAGFAAGPCLFKDTMQLASFYRNQFGLGFQAMLVNEGMPQFIVDRLDAAYPLDRMTVGLLGMAYKAESDDPRFSLSYKLKKILMFRAKAVLTTDPYVKTDADLLGLDEVTRRSDVLILCVPHKAYRDLNLEQKAVVDIWNYLRKESQVKRVQVTVEST